MTEVDWEKFLSEPYNSEPTRSQPFLPPPFRAYLQGRREVGIALTHRNMPILIDPSGQKGVPAGMYRAFFAFKNELRLIQKTSYFLPPPENLALAALMKYRRFLNPAFDKESSPESERPAAKGASLFMQDVQAITIHEHLHEYLGCAIYWPQTAEGKRKKVFLPELVISEGCDKLKTIRTVTFEQSFVQVTDQISKYREYIRRAVGVYIAEILAIRTSGGEAGIEDASDWMSFKEWLLKFSAGIFPARLLDKIPQEQHLSYANVLLHIIWFGEFGVFRDAARGICVVVSREQETLVRGYLKLYVGKRQAWETVRIESVNIHSRRLSKREIYLGRSAYRLCKRTNDSDEQ